MPIFKSGKGLAPPWCEVEYFEIVRLSVGSTHTFSRIGRREKLFVVEGQARVAFSDVNAAAREGDYFDPNLADACFEAVEIFSPCTLVRICGRWGEEVGDCGVFTLENSEHPHDKGDPVTYPKTTDFDSHFHDFDEYWIIVQGSGEVVTEGRLYTVGPGDCVATGMGHHHDFPRVFETVKGVYLETTLEGWKRLGHLWNHTHGRSRPELDRI